MAASIHRTRAGHCASVDAWDGTPAHALGIQSMLASRVELRDGFAVPLRTVAGVAVHLPEGNGAARAAAVLVDADTLDVLASHVAQVAGRWPGAGPASFRAMPAMVEALAGLPRPPDLAFVEGHGVAHPQGLGTAAHFGVTTGVPSIGVAHEALLGSAPATHDTRGAYTALRDGSRRQVGWLLRSRIDREPVVVSPAHRVALASTADLVMRFMREDWLPEPLRLACRLAGTDPGGKTVDD